MDIFHFMNIFQDVENFQDMENFQDTDGHNELYSVNFVRIACSSENITVLCSPQDFDEWILSQFF